MFVLAASLFFTNPAPLDMPKASAYLVKEKGVSRLEDRYDTFDLWTSRTVDGRWIDDDGRVFVTATLATQPPATAQGVPPDSSGALATRRTFAAAARPIERRAAIAALSPVELAEKPRSPRQLPRGYKDVAYWQGTNTSAIVCACLPLKESTWRLAIWELADGDVFDEAREAFEDEFLAREALAVWLGSRQSGDSRKSGDSSPARERELLRRDAAHSVAAYANWRVTDGESFVVLDDLPTRDVAVAYTNDLTRLRKRFVEVLPSPVDGTNTLCVARLYATREEYLDALAASGITNMAWSAAYWSPTRRELVAHADATASASTSGLGLLATLRHESFHQYLSYAAAMIPTSPWLNEGYAQYFETCSADVSDASRVAALDGATPEDLERYSLLLPALLAMDYAEFYDGTDEERRIKYALAHAIAVFLEHGAPKVRFRPFRDVKRDYLAALLETHDMRKATAAAFKSKDLLDKFVGDWLAYWKSHP